MLKGDSDPTAKTGWLTDGKKVTSSAAQQTLLTYTISPDYVSEILKLSLSWILEYLQIDSVPLCTI